MQAQLDKIIANQHLPARYAAAPLGFFKDAARTAIGFVVVGRGDEDRGERELNTLVGEPQTQSDAAEE